MDGIVYFLVAIAFCVGAFLLFRAMVLWYWRIDDILETLKSIDRKLDALAGGKEPPRTNGPSDSGKAGYDPMDYAPKS